MAEPENHFTVFVRLPFKRGDFVDPPPVAWSATKERELWDVISRQSKSNEIDWGSLAEQFNVTQQFLLQQAAWLYERQLSQVRAQMRRMGNRQSATASPAPSSVAASVVTTQPSKRPAGLTSRGPSRLSTQVPASSTPADSSAPNTPARSRTSLPLKPVPSVGTNSTTRGQPTSSRPLSRRSSKDIEAASRTHSRRGSIQQQQLAKSPADLTSSSEDETTTTKPSHRRSNPASTQRRTSSIRKSQHARGQSLNVHQLREQQEEDEDEDDPAFLPFAHSSAKPEHTSTTSTDPSATLRGGLTQPPPSSGPTLTRPNLQRNHTSERIINPQTSANTARQKDTSSQPQAQPTHNLTSSASSLSSNPSSYHLPEPKRHASNPAQHRQQSQPNPATRAQSHQTTLPTPLSPLQQAALATAAGLSPRRRSVIPPNHTHTGSESSPSMGSSFSDLDDASVTQSALEEALMSNMNALGSTAGPSAGGLGSRVSGISQALRSRYFDARSGAGGGGENQR